ncbi:DNA recombination protein RecN [Kribbella antibiotica]|uniref:DNA recombination protein RecN n=1 Tax=Kribbella antibiotica TaxID=190195 RepID=A0A4V2YPN8_9ACTN|nr:DNA recombination protein RecN [Kribbella antibiotica]TDD58837.1 DNA recombination protein RecN [Kribbella antibiotica]
MTGIRIGQLRLAGSTGSDRTYGVSFRERSTIRSLSVIAGPSQTGKTTILDYIRYCLGGSTHPQHEEVLQAVRSALLETELDGSPTVIERAATGSASKFASVWTSRLDELRSADELRLSVEPVGDSDGLSQFLLAACNLQGVLLPESASKDETDSDLLSIRDLFRVIFVPNERLDNRSLVFEQANHMVRQKFRQSIDAMFGIHDNEQAFLAARYRTARENARIAEGKARALRQFADSEHPRGPMQLELDLSEAASTIASLGTELAALDVEQRSTQAASVNLRQQLDRAQRNAKDAQIRVSDRRSLITRLDALRGQYADDQRKLNFLLEAERLFDPLQVTTCPACFNTLTTSPVIVDGHCSLCHNPVDDHDSHDPSQASVAVLEAELRAVKTRLKSLNDYVQRLTLHQNVLLEESVVANEAADAAARAVDAIVTAPAPWLAIRDGLNERLIQATLVQQSAQTGLAAWQRVTEADAQAEELANEARRINAQRKEHRERPDRAELIHDLSARFGQILTEIGYPKLQDPFIGDDLVPHVRHLPYTAASSGGMVLIALAWNLALWEIAHERDADAPGLLIIDSPQKNLGHNSKGDDRDFADAQLVENFYAHAKNWLATDGAGAQLIVVDNSPPESVDEDIVIRFTRRADSPPYGLIPEATS